MACSRMNFTFTPLYMHLILRVSDYVINLVFSTSYVALKSVEIIKMAY